MIRAIRRIILFACVLFEKSGNHRKAAGLTILFFGIMMATAICFAADQTDASTLNARGIVVAKQRPVISSEIAGKIEKLPFQDGEYFKKGDTLVAFDTSLLEAQLHKADAELKGAVLKLENYRELERLESIGTLDVALAEVEVERLRAEKEISDIALKRCRIKAPFDGRVVERMVAEHESVSPNQNLLEIISADKPELEVMVPASWLSWISEKQQFTAMIDTLSVEKKAYITSVGATVDPVSGLVKFKGRFSGETRGLLPGMIATVSFPAKVPNE